MKNRKLFSLGLIVVLAVSVCGCRESTQTGNETTEKILEEAPKEAEEASRIVEEVANRYSGTDAEKEETVYVNADASGNIKEITVSAWLKNGKGLDELMDVTKLTGVANVKGDETFTQDGDTYVWAARGKDIYYQGTTAETLPVDVKVTYYLDDQQIAPEDLAGKSGRVKIRFDYENNSRQQKMIGGKETELCVPFMAASTLILDSDRFVNVEVENGKILSDGKNTIVAGVAMPGLYDSLDLLNLEGFEDVDIPDYVEVTADVTDFKLAMTATVLMPDVFSKLNTEDMDGFDDLKDDIEELNDATYDLIDGCIELDDGVLELKDNMPDLWDGAVELDDGALELKDGAWEIYNGTRDLYDGADQLNEGARDIREGAKELDGGAGTIQAGAGLLKNGVDQLVAGVSNMGTSLEQAIAENQKKMQEAQNHIVLLTGQLEKAVGEAKELQGQLNELAKQMGLLQPGTGTGRNGGAESAGNPPTVPEPVQSDETASDSEILQESDTLQESGDKAAVSEESEREPSQSPEIPREEKTEGGNGSLAAGETIEESEDQNENGVSADSEIPGGDEAESGGNSCTVSGTLDVTSEEAESEDSAAPEAIVEEEPDVQTRAEEELEEAEELSAFARDYVENLGASDGMTSMSMVPVADAGHGFGGTADADKIIEGYRKVVDVQTRLIGKMNEITELQNQLREAATDYAGLAGADQAMRQIAGQLSSSVDAEQLAQLTEGMTGLQNGAEALKNGTGKLYVGGVDLKEGTKELLDGSKELRDGAEELKDGTEELKDGTQELKDGVVDLVDGVDELKDGTEELRDGVHEYNDDGIQKLYDTVNVDLQNLIDRVDAVADLSGSYQSFSGKSDGMEGSVKFIIETEAIELEKDS